MFVAKWNGQVLAKSSNTIKIEGNHYFPPEDVDMRFFAVTDLHTKCPWKGIASYYNITVDGEINENGAWFYPEPLEKATAIKDYVAFWNGVVVEKE